MKDSLFSGFAISALIHAALIPTASLLIAGTRPTTPAQNIEVSLTDVPKVEHTPEPPPESKPEPKKIGKDQGTQTDPKNGLRQGRTQPTTTENRRPAAASKSDGRRSRERQRRQQSARRRGRRKRGGCRWSVCRRRRRRSRVAAVWAEAAVGRRLPD